MKLLRSLPIASFQRLVVTKIGGKDNRKISIAAVARVKVSNDSSYQTMKFHKVD